MLWVERVGSPGFWPQMTVPRFEEKELLGEEVLIRRKESVTTYYELGFCQLMN